MSAEEQRPKRGEKDFRKMKLNEIHRKAKVDSRI